LDTQAAANVIGDGLQFDKLYGPAKMINRPDLCNNRTTDCVITGYMKRINEGKPNLIATISIDEGLDYFRQITK